MKRHKWVMLIWSLMSTNYDSRVLKNLTQKHKEGKEKKKKNRQPTSADSRHNAPSSPSPSFVGDKKIISQSFNNFSMLSCLLSLCAFLRVSSLAASRLSVRFKIVAKLNSHHGMTKFFCGKDSTAVFRLKS